MAAEHKAAFERVEHDLQELHQEYANLNKELDEKQDEIDNYENQLLGKPGSADIPELRRQIRDLEEEIKQHEVEKADMEDQIQTLQRDAATLIEKDGKVARERSDERKTLQNVKLLTTRLTLRKSKNIRSNCARPLKRKSAQNRDSTKRYVWLFSF